MNIKVFLSLLIFLAAMLPVAAQDSFLQKTYIGLSGGATAYNGSLSQKDIKPGVGVHMAYAVTGKILARVNILISELSASDEALANFGPDTRAEKYYFHTNLNEVSLLGQYDIFDLNSGKRCTPYVFAGIGKYDYKPYQKVSYRNERNDLRYANLAMPQSETFSNQQIAVPCGIGVKYALSPNFHLFTEGNYRFTRNKLLDNYSEDGKTDSYYTLQLGMQLRLAKASSARRGAKRADCNCPVY